MRTNSTGYHYMENSNFGDSVSRGAGSRRVGPSSYSAVARTGSRIKRLLGGLATIQTTGRFLRRQLWAWPILAALLLGLAGWWVNNSVETSMRQRRAEELTTILNADVTALQLWMTGQEENAHLIALDERLTVLIEELLALPQDKINERLLADAKAQTELRRRLAPRIRLFGYVGYFIIAPSFQIIAADHDHVLGQALTEYRKEFFGNILSGKVSVSKPYRSLVLLPNKEGKPLPNLPTMFAAAPLRDEAGKVIAALGLRIRPEDQFTEILQVARSGQTGETYAFDRRGLLLSQSRFDDVLKQIGLLVDQAEARSILHLEVRDPQVDMTTGERPTLRRADQPLTRMAADATLGHEGIDVDGYRDYRGVPSIGAWVWLSEYDFGVATEVDVAEAFRPLYILRRAFRVMIGLLVLAAVGIFVLMLFLARQQRQLQDVVLAAKQLGQYSLKKKLGAGGMGTVYLAQHAFLRRPTAVKLLDVDKMSDAAVARFEREVQLTSTLTHPNTVAVFDYGRTPEGIFYYAMEYLDGLNLDDLVRIHGPLPEARVVWIMRQVCGALAEAHGLGLIHRDIKPANIFLTCRGGMHDFVKVLDFGLVKALGVQESANLTSIGAVTGTPLYLSPEGVNTPEQVDARSDVYAIAAVGYFLLAGSPVFTGASIMEICMKHLKADPELLSIRCQQAVSPSLEQLVLRGLAKSQADRPASAATFLSELNACAVTGAWTAADAASWWATQVKKANQATTQATPNVAIGYGDATLAHDNKTLEK